MLDWGPPWRLRGFALPSYIVKKSLTRSLNYSQYSETNSAIDWNNSVNGIVSTAHYSHILLPYVVNKRKQ